MRRPSYTGKLAALAFVIVLIFSAAACTGKPAPSTRTQLSPGLISLQKNKYLTARLYGMVTYEFCGDNMTYPTELIIASVPLEWMGQVFNGKLTGTFLLDQVHGGISADGEWLMTLTFSRQIVRPNDSVFYSVAVRNIPIAAKTSGTGKAGAFEKEGDIQKYVERVDYLARGVNVPTANYTSTDWTNEVQGFRPTLKLTFEEAPSIVPPGVKPVAPMM